LLIISCTMGSGKTTVLAEAADILAARHITHAAIDLDAFGLVHLPSAVADDNVMYRNLRAVRKNYASVGVNRLLLARALEDGAEFDLCRGAVSAKNTVVCRLTASIETMQQRVRTRESGVSQEKYVARVARLNAILNYAGVEDFVVTSKNRTVTEVAHAVLFRAGCIQG
jgi:predicted kinase